MQEVNKRQHQSRDSQTAAGAVVKSHKWSVQPWRLSGVEFADLNVALRAAGHPPWSPDFETRNNTNRLFKRQMLLQAGIEVESNVERQERYWGKAVVQAGRRIVGVALVDAARPLRHGSSWEESLCFHGTSPLIQPYLVAFPVLDVACFGGFAEFCPDELTEVCNVSTTSPALLPVVALGASDSRHWERNSLGSLSVECVEAMLNLPCYRVLPYEKGLVGGGCLF